MGSRKEELIKEKMIIFEEFLSKLDLTNDQIANTAMKSWLKAYSVGVDDGIKDKNSNNRIVFEVDIDSMLKLQEERLWGMGKLLQLPPTDGTFVKNLLAMYQKGIDDTIIELNRMTPNINIRDKNTISQVLNEAIEDDYIPDKYKWVARLVTNRIKARINLE